MVESTKGLSLFLLVEGQKKELCKHFPLEKPLFYVYFAVLALISVETNQSFDVARPYVFNYNNRTFSTFRFGRYSPQFLPVR